MRGLNDDEAEALETVACLDLDDDISLLDDRVLDRLTARGLLRSWTGAWRGQLGVFWDITPVGRLILQVHRSLPR